jgi:hypothetical protein
MSSASRGEHDKSFAYHAQCTGFSAALTKPCCENIPGQASIALSKTGGESYSRVEKFNWKGLITFDEASAYATGSRDHGAYNTLSTVTIRNLNVANMVHADLVVARVTSKHQKGADEGDITFAGSMIRNLTVAGEPVELEFEHEAFASHPTYAAFAQNVNNLGVTTPYVDPKTGVVTCSLLRAARAATLKPSGYTITVPEFGTIYIAQVIIRPGYRRLSMLRFELGCPLAGSAEAGGSESNGIEYWP